MSDQLNKRDNSNPLWPTCLILLVAVLTLGYEDYWAYSAAYHQNPANYQDLLRGTGRAPEQYRIAVLRMADALAHHNIYRLRYSLCYIDVVATLIAVYALLLLLYRSDTYRNASVIRRWSAMMAFVMLIEFYFAWVLWYQRPETLPSAALISLTLLLITTELPLSRTLRYLVTAVLLLLLSILQDFVRADVSFALHAGIFLACLTKAGEDMSLPRSIQASISMLAVFVSGGIQYYLMHIRFPQAKYSTDVFQLVRNLTTPSEWIAFFLFLAPSIWTARTALGRRKRLRGSEVAILVSSLVFLWMWLLLGRAKEVRIFLPFSFALVPLTVVWALEEFVPDT